MEINFKNAAFLLLSVITPQIMMGCCVSQKTLPADAVSANDNCKLEVGNYNINKTQADKTFTESTLRSTGCIVSENIIWEMDVTVVAATITRPDDEEIHPAVVFVAGSGPTDRDWNSPLLPGTNGSAKLLAEELAKNGYITIRYDKRFTGPNAEKNREFLLGKLSRESHVDELAGAVDRLIARPDVNPERVFVIANSEGTIHAMNYQLTREPAFAGLILEGMPGRSLADVTHAQLEAQMAAYPEVIKIMAGYDSLMAGFLEGGRLLLIPNSLRY